MDYTIVSFALFAGIADDCLEIVGVDNALSDHDYLHFTIPVPYAIRRDSALCREVCAPLSTLLDCWQQPTSQLGLLCMSVISNAKESETAVEDLYGKPVNTANPSYVYLGTAFSKSSRWGAFTLYFGPNARRNVTLEVVDEWKSDNGLALAALICLLHSSSMMEAFVIYTSSDWMIHSVCH